MIMGWPYGLGIGRINPGPNLKLFCIEGSEEQSRLLHRLQDPYYIFESQGHSTDYILEENMGSLGMTWGGRGYTELFINGYR